MRTIQVTGKGNIKVHPDSTRITIRLIDGQESYGETLVQSAADTEKLRNLITTIGFPKESLKTTSFDVEPQYEYYDDEKGERKSRFIGYEYTHELKLEFMSDNEILGKILYALANSVLAPEFRLSYFVQDVEAVKNTLISKAVADARRKAEVLTQAAGVELKAVQYIDYSWKEIYWEREPMRDMCYEAIGSCAPGSLQLNIEPDDIKASDTVTVSWEIS